MRCLERGPYVYTISNREDNIWRAEQTARWCSDAFKWGRDTAKAVERSFKHLSVATPRGAYHIDFTVPTTWTSKDVRLMLDLWLAKMTAYQSDGDFSLMLPETLRVFRTRAEPCRHCEAKDQQLQELRNSISGLKNERNATVRALQHLPETTLAQIMVSNKAIVTAAKEQRLATCGACGCERVVDDWMRNAKNQFKTCPEQATDQFYCGCQDDPGEPQLEPSGPY